jgi:hypothetical protein
MYVRVTSIQAWISWKTGPTYLVTSAHLWNYCRAAVAAASAAVATLSSAISASAEDLAGSDSVNPADDFFLESVLITVLMYVVLMSVYVWVSELLAQVGFQRPLPSCAASFKSLSRSCTCSGSIH